MSKWIDASLAERLVMLQNVANQKQIVDSAVEKDWWVTLVLKALFTMPYSKYLLFKGGTSLSKGWDLIKRFSEDIDLTISRQFFLDVQNKDFINCTSNKQRRRLREAAHDFLKDELCNALSEAIHQLGVTDFVLEPLLAVPQEDGTYRPIDHDTDPTTLILTYKSISQTQLAYVPPMVKIEISCLGMDEPFEQRTISSLVWEYFAQEDDEMQVVVPTVLPSRTFLEKTFLLNEEFQRPTPRSQRMSRHLYDIEKLMHTHWAEEALRDEVLYTNIVAHRKQFYHKATINYDTNLPQSINFIPQGELATRYASDYEDMLRTYIYDRQNAPSYQQLIERLVQLQESFNVLNYETKL